MIFRKWRWFLQNRCLRCGEKLTSHNTGNGYPYYSSTKCATCLEQLHHEDVVAAAHRRVALQMSGPEWDDAKNAVKELVGLLTPDERQELINWILESRANR